MSDARYRVSVANPSLRSHVLAEHGALDEADAVELAEVYHALGYTDVAIHVEVGAAGDQAA